MRGPKEVKEEVKEKETKKTVEDNEMYKEFVEEQEKYKKMKEKIPKKGAARLIYVFIISTLYRVRLPGSCRDVR